MVKAEPANVGKEVKVEWKAGRKAGRREVSVGNSVVFLQELGEREGIFKAECSHLVLP